MATQSSCSQTNMEGEPFNAGRSAGSPLRCCQLRKERDEDHSALRGFGCDGTVVPGGAHSPWGSLMATPFFYSNDLAFTNSANRTVINSTLASLSQLGGGQLLQGRCSSTGLSHSRWGFCSFIVGVGSRHSFVAPLAFTRLAQSEGWSLPQASLVGNEQRSNHQPLFWRRTFQSGARDHSATRF